MTSPVLSEFSDIATLSADGIDAQDILPFDPRNDDIANAVSDPIKMLPPLDSFVPIIEKLPGLVLDNNQYFVDGPLLLTELHQLMSYTRRIEEIVLTDVQPINHPEVASETIARFASVQDPRSPFLSSLECLRVIGADQSLRSYLFFCVTSSLKTLEITGVPSHRQITISSFFKELVLGAPQLANIIVLDRIPESVLKCIPTFNNLRQLHLMSR